MSEHERQKFTGNQSEVFHFHLFVFRNYDKVMELLCLITASLKTLGLR